MRFPLWRRRRDEELEEELRSHLEMAKRDRLERGESAEDAAESARREFGNIGLVKEVTRDMWGWRWLEQLGQDLHYGVRMLMRKPGFTLIAVITLALGIGANTAVFSVADVVLLHPFPYPDHSRIYYVYQHLPKIGEQRRFGVSGLEFTGLAERKFYDRIAAVHRTMSLNLAGGQEPERITAARVSADFFSLLGVNPLLGRTIKAEDQWPRGQRVLVISHGLWQRRFGGSTQVIGQKVSLDEEPYTIVGVMPANFFYYGRDAWLPFSSDLHESSLLGVLVRLKPGVSQAQANAELEVLARNQEQAWGNNQPEYIGRSIYLRPIYESYFGEINHIITVLLGAVGLILLIACANIANLLLARATARTREIALRAALGAGRLRIVRQLLTESLALALLGGALGLLLAFLGVDAIVALIPHGTIPAELRININGEVLVGAFIVSVISALMFGLWPALSMSKPDLNIALKEGPQTSAGLRLGRNRSMLVVFQVAISLVLFVIAGLTVRSFLRLIDADPGFNTENLLTMRLNIPPARTNNGQPIAPIFQQLSDRIRTVPGVQSVGVASHIPFDQTESWTVTVERNVSQGGAQTGSVDTRTISTDYLQVMGIRLIDGAGFTAQDRQGAPYVVIINQAMARRYWPDESAVGKRLKVGGRTSNNPWATVKGVVADSVQSSLSAPIDPEVYFPHGQMAYCCRRMNLIMRTNADSAGLIGSIKHEIQSLNKDQPVYNVLTMDEFIARDLSTLRFTMILLGVFAGVALALSCVGVYGVISYFVAQCTREFGIRIAMGAQARDVLRPIVARGMILVLIGVALGLGASFALTRLVESLLFGVGTMDPMTFVMSALLLTLVALLACWFPARRATKVDPLVALRCE
jgi:putative ABC transport system permease protein